VVTDQPNIPLVMEFYLLRNHKFTSYNLNYWRFYVVRHNGLIMEIDCVWLNGIHNTQFSMERGMRTMIYKQVQSPRRYLL
jgi:hypothetical protein